MNFTPEEGISLGDWQTKRRQVLAQSQAIQVVIAVQRVKKISATQLIVTFTQRYQSDTYQVYYHKSPYA
jgi:hypothetical protein